MSGDNNPTLAVFGYQTEIQTFVQKGLWDNKRQFGECVAIGFANKTGLVAGVVYHNYEPESKIIEISAYSSQRKWLTKKHLSTIFEYPFGQLRLRLVIARCNQNNQRVRRIWKNLGANEVILPELRAENEDEIVLMLKNNQWRKSKFMRKTKWENQKHLNQ